MPNWAAGFGAFGQAAGRVGLAFMEREQREIESMRQKALAELQINTQLTIHREETAARAAEHADTMALGREQLQETTREHVAGEAAALSRLDKEIAAHEKVAGMQIGAARESDVMRAIETVTQRAEQEVVALERERSREEQEILKLKGSGSADPAVIQEWEGRLSRYDEAIRNVRLGARLTSERLMSGGYGKPGSSLTEAEVRSRLGVKRVPTEPSQAQRSWAGNPLNPDFGTPNALFGPAAPGAAPAAAPAVASAGGATGMWEPGPTEPTLFGNPAGGSGVQLPPPRPIELPAVGRLGTGTLQRPQRSLF